MFSSKINEPFFNGVNERKSEQYPEWYEASDKYAYSYTNDGKRENQQ